MKKGTIAGLIVIFGTVTVLKAQDMNNNSTVNNNNNNNNNNTTIVHDDGSPSLYRDQEFTVDIFAGGTLNESDFNEFGEQVRHDGRVGMGGGGSFFFVRNLGIEGEVYTENPDGHFIDEASGNLVLRAPIGETGLAPYIFGGAGHRFDPVSCTLGQAGAGLELRFCPNVGVFTDARWVVTDRMGNYGMGRAGLRLAF
jgi:hypothetical protein